MTFSSVSSVSRVVFLSIILSLLAACGGGGDGGTAGSGAGAGGGGGGGGGTQVYTVGGTITGLSGSGLVLQDNGADDLTVSGTGFTFSKSVASGAGYAVTVKTQPSNPAQTCTLSGATGAIGSANVTSVALTCTTNAYMVGGTVTGLSGSGLVLQDNSGDDLDVSNNGSFVFAKSVASGAAYNVTVKTAPTGPTGPTGPTQACVVTSGAGTVGSGSVTNVVVYCGPIALLAGGLGGMGSIDGIASTARFQRPYGVVVDFAGNTYVADAYNHTIRKVTAAGVVSTFAGTAGQHGSTDGIGSAARFNFPAGVALDSVGNLYVADASNSTIRKITPAGAVSTLAGTAGQRGSTDGAGGAARFELPCGLTIDSGGNLYVADADASTVRKVTPAGVVSTVAGTPDHSGSTDGAGSAARFAAPFGIAADAAGNLYVTDSGNNTIRKIATGGMVSTLTGVAGKAGSADGGPGVGLFSAPYGITVDSAGNLFVVDSTNDTIRKISSTGVVSTLAGSAGSVGSIDGTGSAALFSHPTFLALDPTGVLYVADGYNDTIRKITAAGVVSTFVGAARQPGSADGSGSVARFNVPYGVAADAAGNLYVADSYNCIIRKITAAGVVSTLAGSAGKPGTLDGSGGSARFNYPYDVAVDSAGNVYVADSNNNEIRKITPAGVVTTLAGNGLIGSADGTGTAASFFNPHGITVDSAGNLYVADTYNYTIRKVTPDGTVSTLAGTAGIKGSTDATGAAASFNVSMGIAIDSTGNLYVADSNSNVIRKIASGAIVTTPAGMSGQAGSIDGTGSAARFSDPTYVALDSAGNLYVSDTGNSAIRKITSSGVVSTVVGTPGAVGVKLGPLPGSLNMPYGLSVLPGDGVTLAVADGEENLVLRIALP